MIKMWSQWATDFGGLVKMAESVTFSIWYLNVYFISSVNHLFFSRRNSNPHTASTIAEVLLQDQISSFKTDMYLVYIYNFSNWLTQNRVRVQQNNQSVFLMDIIAVYWRIMTWTGYMTLVRRRLMRTGFSGGKYGGKRPLGRSRHW